MALLPHGEITAAPPWGQCRWDPVARNVPATAPVRQGKHGEDVSKTHGKTMGKCVEKVWKIKIRAFPQT